MEPPLNEILLVDDCEADLFLHRLVVDRARVTKRVTVARDGQEALEYLTEPGNLSETGGDNAAPHPDLILLDISMPRMDGWEFLDRLETVKGSLAGYKIVVMLTGSTHPTDQRRAQTHPLVHGQVDKPLTDEKFAELLAANFPDGMD